jgi:hypothetical protein
MADKKEQAILSWFKTRQEAEKAVDQLKSIGVEAYQIAETSAYPNLDQTEHWTNPITGHIPSLSTLTFGFTPNSRDAAILLGASADASGMSDGRDEGGGESLAGYNYLLTIVVDSSIVEQCVDTIKKGGGWT